MKPSQMPLLSIAAATLTAHNIPSAHAMPIEEGPKTLTELAKKLAEDVY